MSTESLSESESGLLQTLSQDLFKAVLKSEGEHVAQNITFPVSISIKTY